MLRLKLSDNPPPDACLIGYYSGTEFGADEHLGLLDASWEWPENRTGREDAVQVVHHGTPWDAITSGDVVIGNQSARIRDLTEPTPLPWGHRIGNNTAFGRKEYYVFNPLANTYSPTTQVEDIIAELKRDIRVINADGTLATDVIWDLDLVDSGGDNGKITLGASFGWRVYIYVNKKPDRFRPLLVRFTAVETAVDAAGDPVVVHNFEELINAAPYITGTVAEPGTTPASTGYVLELQSDNTLRLVLGSSPPANAMAVAFWTDTTDRDWQVVASGFNKDLHIRVDSTTTILGTVHNINLLSVREVVQEINALNLDVKATALLDAPSCDLAVTTGTIDQFGANPALMENHVFAYYENDTRMFIDLPADQSRSEDWHAVIDGSPIRYTITDTADPQYGYELTYNLSESAWMPFSGLNSTHLEEIDEPIALLSERFGSVRHEDIDLTTLRLKMDGVLSNALIEDYDASSGILRFSRDIISGEDITVDYCYNPGYKVVFDAIDLNPGQLHLPDSYRLYIGLYVIPNTVVPPGGSPVSHAPTIGYVVANTISEIAAAISNLTDAVSGLSLNAKLLGIFQSNSQGEASDVGVLDVRSHGGGIAEGLDLESIFKDAPEVQFFSDIGYWDGQPYAGSGVIVIQGPSTILGNDTSMPGLIAPADGGLFDTTGRQNIDDIRRRLKKHHTVGHYGVVDLE